MIYLRKANQRGHVNQGWVDSRFTFSFADYYDPRFMGFSVLRVINEDVVQPLQGFGLHPHENMEILSYVLSGVIEHQDSLGNKCQIKAGEIQLMSAGSGIRHSEFNPDPFQSVHFYQIWLLPNKRNVTPRYQQKSLKVEEARQLLLSADGKDALFKVYQDMRLWHWHLSAKEQADYPLASDRVVWIQVVKGSLLVNGHQVDTGDGVAITEEARIAFQAQQPSDILLFELPKITD